MRKVLVVVASYSEAIRVAPLVRCLQSVPSMQTFVCAAVQHRQVLERALGNFGIGLDETFDAISPDSAHGIDSVIGKYQPDCVLIQGNSTSTIKSALLRFPGDGTYPGLQMFELGKEAETNDRGDPTAKYIFVSSESLRDELLREGVAVDRIYLTDNMTVDAVQMAAQRIESDEPLRAALASSFPFLEKKRHLILVTEHWHDNREGRLTELCCALKRLAMRPDVQVVYPLHYDYKVNETVAAVFENHPNIFLVHPQDYLHSVYLMQTARLILTDLGSRLIEALSLNKPVLVLRDAGDLPEALDIGAAKLVGTDCGPLLRECSRFLDDDAYSSALADLRNPYGDGHACQRIVETLLR